MTGQTGGRESFKRLGFGSVGDGKLQGCKGIRQRSWLKSLVLKNSHLLINCESENKGELWNFCRSQFSPSATWAARIDLSQAWGDGPNFELLKVV